MGEPDTVIKKIIELLEKEVDRSFTEMPRERRGVVGILLIFALVIAVFLALSLWLAPDRFHVPLLVGLGLVILFIPIAILLSRTKDGADQELESGSNFPFANRESEITEIADIKEHATPLYYLVDGPAGYGKTELLTALKLRFEKDGKTCALVQVQYGSGIDAIIESLLTELELDRKQVYRNGINRFDALAKAIYKKIDGKAFVLLFDFDKILATNELDRLITDLLPPIRDILKTHLGTRLNANHYRVIIAGRGVWSYISNSQQLLTSNKVMGFKKLLLSSFTYAAVCESAQKYFPDENPDAIDQLAAHTLYFTGGHPGCMAKTLLLFEEKGTGPNSFFENYADEVWNDIVSLAVNDVLAAISPELRSYFNELSLYCSYDEHTIREILSHRFGGNGESTQSLYRKITVTGLVGKAYPARGEIVGRLLSIWLRNIDKNHYRDLSNFVVESYMRLLGNQQDQRSIAQLFIDSLSQRIRHEYELFPDCRENLRKRFFAENGILDEYVGYLPQDSLDTRERLRSRLEDENKSWEFRFSVNYFLCNGCYDGNSYNELLARIEQHFEQGKN